MRLLVLIFFIQFYSALNALSQSNYYGVGNGLNQYVRSMYYDSVSEKLYVGGQFVNTIDTLPVYGTAVWDGQQWDSLNSGIKPNSPFSGSLPWWPSRILKYQNKIFFCGNFMQVDGKDYQYLAYWDGMQWDTLPGAPNSVVWDMLVVGNDLYISGLFTAIGSDTTIKYVAKWDGNNWSSVGNISSITGNSPPPQIFSLEMYKNELYAGGVIFLQNGNPVHILKYDFNVWGMVGNGIQEPGPTFVDKIITYDSLLFIGGNFTAPFVDNTSNNLTLWNGDNFLSIGTSSGLNGIVRDMYIKSGKLYIGGYIEAINNNTVFSLVSFDGISWCNSLDTINNSVMCLAEFKDTLIIASGFISINQDTIHEIAYYFDLNNPDVCIPSTVGIVELESRSFDIYPNPTSNNFTIVSNNVDGTNFEIKAYNSIGEILYNDTFKNSLTINCSQWERGLYFLIISDGKKQWSQKIIKQ